MFSKISTCIADLVCNADYKSTMSGNPAIILPMKSPESRSGFNGQDFSVNKELRPEWSCVFFDSEGLLVHAGSENNLWRRLYVKKGIVEKHTRLKKLYLERRDLESRTEWADLEHEDLKEAGLTKAEYDEEVNSIPLVEDAREVISTLHSWGYETGIISGGSGDLVKRLQKELGIKIGIGLYNPFFNQQGILDGWDFLPSDYTGKAGILREFANKLNIPPSEVVYVGHGVNDKFACKEANLSFTIADIARLDETAGSSFALSRLKDILKYMPPRWGTIPPVDFFI